MKKLPFLLLLSLFFYGNQSFAQCSLQDVRTSILSVNSVGSNCSVTFNVSFKINNNGGNKIIVIQSWKEEDYPNYWGPSCNDQNKGPIASQLGATLPFLNIAFDVSSQTVIQNYGPDASVVLGSGYGVESTGIADASGYMLIKLTNLTVLLPNSCSEGVTVKTDVWSSQASVNSTWRPHCVICNNTYSFNYPKVSGIQGCQLVNGQNERDYSFKVVNSNTDQTIQYTYKIFRDAQLPGQPGFNEYDDMDVLVANETSPTTLAAGDSTIYPAVSYPGNSGTTLNSKLFIVVNVVGLSNSVVSTCSQTGCAILPVSLKHFNASAKNNAVVLSWETADEINNKGFEIQRRLNGAATYERIGFVDAKAEIGLGASYTFVDQAARNKGSVAYRLAQTDLDGKISLSDIRIVNTGAGNSQILVYPNPSKGLVKISLPVQSGKADVSLEDFSGKTIQRWNAYSTNTLQIDQIRPGIYLIRVRLQETGEQMIERLIVQ